MDRRRTIALAALAGAALAAGWPSPASADCCLPTAATSLNVGASPEAVPTNALIRIDYTLGTNQSCVFGTEEMLVDGICRSVLGDDGSAVAGTWRQVPSERGHVTLLFEPEEPFEPHSSYRVVDGSGSAWMGEAEDLESLVCDPVDPSLASAFEGSFTTGAGPDTTGPTIDGQAEVSCRSFAFERGAACDVFPDETITAWGFEFAIEGVTAEDPSLAGLRVEVRRPDGTPVGEDHAGPLSFLRMADCGCGGDQPETRLPEGYEDYVLAIYAEDIAGNRSEAEVTVPWSRGDCSVEDIAGGGCDCAAAGPSDGPGSALFLGLLALAGLAHRLGRRRGQRVTR